ncbi:MAG: ORF6N domain-containing protein [Elusimicrobiota bacterium]
MLEDKRAVSIVLPLILTVRGQRVILDSDLAALYGTTTGRLNEQVRRNQRRFPVDFAFPLSRHEYAAMISQFAISSGKRRNWRKPPIAYTEHGAVMAANVLNSSRAITMSVEIVRAFIRLRKTLLSHDLISKKVAELERAVKTRLNDHDIEIELLFQTVEFLLDKG